MLLRLARVGESDEQVKDRRAVRLAAQASYQLAAARRETKPAVVVSDSRLPSQLVSEQARFMREEPFPGGELLQAGADRTYRGPGPGGLSGTAEEIARRAGHEEPCRHDPSVSRQVGSG